MEKFKANAYFESIDFWLKSRKKAFRPVVRKPALVLSVTFFFSLCDSYRLERILTVRSVYLWLSRLFKQIIMIFFIYKTWKIMSAFWVVPRIKLVYVCKSRASSSYLIFFFFGKDSKRMSYGSDFLIETNFRRVFKLFHYNGIFSNWILLRLCSVVWIFIIQRFSFLWH